MKQGKRSPAKGLAGAENEPDDWLREHGTPW